MGFKRNSDFSDIEKVLTENKKKKTLVGDSVHQTPIVKKGSSVKKVKKVKEVMKPFNFTMKPSIREKLNTLVEYDADYEADSASSYISEFIEKRFSELELDNL